MEKISLRGELEMRNTLFQESRAKDFKEIEELRRICCEESNRARQARIDELSSASREGSDDCESIIGSNSGLTE